jgi:hypothetical protein
MLLTAHNLVPYLLDRGLVDPAAVVDGDLQVAESSRRHLSFKILRRRGTGLFVKQAKDWDPQTIHTLEREAACYRLAAEDAAFAPLRAVLPEFRGYDTERRALILELLPGGDNLTEYQERRGELPVEIAGRLGQILGRYQEEIPPAALTAAFPGLVPWVLQLSQLSLEPFQAFGPAALRVLSLVRADPALLAALDRLRQGWSRTALIHGDLKWDNCLVHANGGGPAVKIIDWELADLGDPLWDAGALLQASLLHWIWSMPLDEPLPAEELVARARFPLATLRPALRAFWESYLSARGIAAAEARGLLELAAGYAAARMIQTAFEYAVVQPQRPNHSLYLLQASFHILTRRQDALRDLLDL